MTYLVAISNGLATTQYGPFRKRATAEKFADRVESERPDLDIYIDVVTHPDDFRSEWFATVGDM